MRLAVPFVPLVLTVERRPLARPRWKLRDAMVAVALVALATALGIYLAGLGRRAARFRALGEEHAHLASFDEFLHGQALTSMRHAEGLAREAAEEARQRSERGDRAGAAPYLRLAADHASSAARLKESSALWLARVDYHARLAAKYRAAAKVPLLPVWSDPAAP